MVLGVNPTYSKHMAIIQGADGNDSIFDLMARFELMRDLFHARRTPPKSELVIYAASERLPFAGLT